MILRSSIEIHRVWTSLFLAALMLFSGPGLAAESNLASQELQSEAELLDCQLNAAADDDSSDYSLSTASDLSLGFTCDAGHSPGYCFPFEEQTRTGHGIRAPPLFNA